MGGLVVTRIALVLVLASATAHADSIRHVPPGEAEAGATVDLIVEASATTPTLVAHVRPTGSVPYRAVELVRRDDGHWGAQVPAETPGLDYYIDAGGEPVFATAQWPQTIPVHLDEDASRRARDVLRSSARRYRMESSGEWVSFGQRASSAMTVPDNYYRIDADLAYRLWSYPLEEIRVGYTRITNTDTSLGFKVGGWAELGLAPIEGVRFDLRAVVMAAKDGFAVGGRAEGRLGDREGSHVALGVEYYGDVGSDGYFRLGWATVPGLPMSATVEITDLPASTSPTGVRFYYDVARELGYGVRVGVRVGYAARTEDVAGICGGGGASWNF
jgi:hypothetical protein